MESRVARHESPPLPTEGPVTVSLLEIAASFDHNDHGMRQRCGAIYASLRAGCPVFWTEAWGGYWVASRYQDVYEAAGTRIGSRPRLG